LVKDDVAVFHKIAIDHIDAKCDVFKYGEVIGKALSNIEKGSWAHIHNIKNNRS